MLQQAGLIQRNAELPQRAQQEADKSVAADAAEVHQHNQLHAPYLRRQLQGKGGAQTAAHAGAMAAAEKAGGGKGEECEGGDHGVVFRDSSSADSCLQPAACRREIVALAIVRRKLPSGNSGYLKTVCLLFQVAWAGNEMMGLEAT